MIDTQTNNVIGITGIYTEEQDEIDNCWLGWFCVDKKYRGKGISKLLLSFSIDKALTLNKTRINLYAYNYDESKEAISLYKSYGFIQYKDIDNYLYFKKNIVLENINNFPILYNFLYMFFDKLNITSTQNKISNFELDKYDNKDGFSIILKNVDKDFLENCIKIYNTTHGTIILDTKNDSMQIFFLFNAIGFLQQEIIEVLNLQKLSIERCKVKEFVDDRFKDFKILKGKINVKRYRKDNASNF